MTIGITPHSPNALPASASASSPAQATPRNAGDAVAAAAAPTEASAQVALSSAATTLLSGAQSATSEFDSAKVDRISRAIQDGTFTVDAGAIADKLIANAAELLSNTTPKP